jgi:hypothetical protein
MLLDRRLTVLNLSSRRRAYVRQDSTASPPELADPHGSADGRGEQITT